ncbi:Sulfotransferase [Cocos nucifera]|nr:Sulfotransferase [Cocos nucifera]
MTHPPPLSRCLASQAEQEDQNHESIYQHFTKLVSALSADAETKPKLYRHPDEWHASLDHLVGAMVAQQHFKARPTDVLLASFPKSGTTWLKALLFATLNRSSYSNSQHHPFTTLSPHECVPFLESQVYTNNRIPDLDVLPSPRLFSTHIPFRSLPQSVMKQWSISVRGSPGLGRIGIMSWDTGRGTWKGLKVLFLTYEEVMQAPLAHLTRLAEFIGCPFTMDEEKEGVVGAIIRLCAFENLSCLEVNKNGKTRFARTPIENSMFYRRGVVGDWVNNLTLEMVRRLEEITEGKFGGSGLPF